jgi:hypothetical protein
MVLADLTGVFAKRDIKHPVQLVFYRPVGSRCSCQFLSRQGSRTDVVALLQIRVTVRGTASSI